VVIALATACVLASADPVKQADIRIVDGDTIEALGKRIRLGGFDALELGDYSHCGLERMLGARANAQS
jgi:endonuclease YncB( thermonuclease family)